MAPWMKGLLIFVAVDGLLCYVGVWLLRSRARSGQGHAARLSLLDYPLAVLVHTMAGAVAAVVMDDFKLAVFLAIPTGLAPVVIFMRVLNEASESIASEVTEGVDATPLFYLSEANRLVKKGDVEGAISEYRRRFTEYPDLPDPLFGIEFLCEQQGRYEEAAEVCREVLRRFQGDDVTWAKASRLLESLLREHLGDPGTADKILEAIHERNPDAPHGYVVPEKPRPEPRPLRRDTGPRSIRDLDQARRLATRGETDKAVTLFRRFAKEHPEEPRALFEAASALELAERYGESVGMLQEVVNKFGENDTVWGEATLRLATLNETHLGDREAARAILKQILKRLMGTEFGGLARERLHAMDPPGPGDQ